MIHPIPPICMVNYFLQKLTTIKKEEDFHSFYVISGFHNQAKQFLNRRPRVYIKQRKERSPFRFPSSILFFFPQGRRFSPSVHPSVSSLNRRPSANGRNVGSRLSASLGPVASRALYYSTSPS